MKKEIKEVVHRKLSWFHKSGSTDAILKHNELVDQIQELDRQITEEYQEAVKGFRVHYTLTPNVFPAKSSNFNSDPIEGTEMLSFHGTANNPYDVEALLETHGQCPSYDKDFNSVQYYRVNNVVCHAHGGHCILKDHVICSDEEWEAMKLGKIPEHLVGNFELAPENILVLQEL